MRITNVALLAHYRKSVRDGREHARRWCRTRILERIRRAECRHRGPEHFGLDRLPPEELLQGLGHPPGVQQLRPPFWEQCATELQARMDPDFSLG